MNVFNDFLHSFRADPDDWGGGAVASAGHTLRGNGHWPGTWPATPRGPENDKKWFLKQMPI